jgi:hypothetical protein
MQDRRPRLPQNLKIKHERPVLHIAELESHRVTPGQIRTPAHLPEPGDARLDSQSALHAVAVSLGLVGQQRARADQGHVAAYYVDELRQLIHRPPSQPDANSRHPGIVVHLEQNPRGLVAGEQLRFELVRIHDHGAQLVEREPPTVLAHPDLAKQRRAAIV